jgi:hypothetical protein
MTSHTQDANLTGISAVVGERILSATLSHIALTRPQLAEAIVQALEGDAVDQPNPLTPDDVPLAIEALQSVIPGFGMRNAEA